MKSEHVLGSLNAADLWMTCPLKFNDPFDTQWDPAWLISGPEFKARFLEVAARVLIDRERLESVLPDAAAFMEPGADQLLDRQRRSFMAVPTIEGRKAELAAMVEKLCALPSSLEVPSMFKPPPALEQSRALCLSETPSSLLMWSHYASQHTGAVLKLDMRHLFQAGTKVGPVRYLNAMPMPLTIDQWVGMLLGGAQYWAWQIVEALMYTKAIEWSYEQEWRVWQNHPFDRDIPLRVPLPRAAVVEVCFGCKMTNEARQAVAGALTKWPNTRARQAVRRRDSFAIDFVDVATP